MAATLTTYANAVKTTYLKKIREQLQVKVPLYDIIPKTSDGVAGDDIIMQLRTGFNEGIGAVSEGGALPTAGNSTYSEATVPTQELYGRLQITYKLMKASRNNAGAFERALTAEMKGLSTNFSHNVNRMLHGDGSGTLALVDMATPSTSLEVDAAYAVANDISGTRLMRKGMRLAIHSAKTGGTQRTGTAVITAVTTTPATPLYRITIDALPTGTANSDHIFRANSRGNEFVGLLGAIDADAASTTYKQTYMNINRNTAGNEFWDANFIDNSGTARALTEELMQEAVDLIDINGDGTCTHIVCDHFQMRKYESLVKGDRRFITKTALKIAGGRSEKQVPTFDNIPILVDKYAVPGFMQFMDVDTFKLYLMNTDGPEWLDDDGAVLKNVSGFASYEAILGLLGDLGCERPTCNTSLRDLAVS